MDRVFSVDDISDQFWSSPPDHLPESNGENSSKMMNRSSSEWAFQRFLQEADKEDVVEIKYQDHPPVTAPVVISCVAPPNVPIDSEEYQVFLKSRLNLACAAVASRTTSVKPPETASSLPDTGSQTSNASQSGSQVSAKGSCVDNTKGQSDKDAVAIPKKSPGTVQVRSATSGSSRDQSDDDDLDLDTETTENMDPVDVKRVRSVVRMLSNRESARRSRRRKQAHLTELETQVSQLRVENSTLLKRLSDVTTKYSEAAVDNRVLKADVETLRAKVKMAEETVKRVTGLNPFFQAMSEISSGGIPSFDCSASDTSAEASVHTLPDEQQKFYHQNNHVDPRVQNGMADMLAPDNNSSETSGSKMGRTDSMQRVASLEHLQKRIRGGSGDV
jgi:hypothetical protein